jgi:hypothetical protein
LVPTDDIIIVLPGTPPGDAAGFLSPACPAALEMHGLVGITPVTESDLAGVVGGRRTLTIITRRDDWSVVARHMDELLVSSSCVFIEGPAPAGLLADLGVRTAASAGLSPPETAAIVDPDLRSSVAAMLAGFRGRDEIDLNAIAVVSFELEDRNGTKTKRPVDIESPLHRPATGGLAFSPCPNDVDGEDILADATSASRVLLTRRGNVVVSSFPVLDLLARRLASPGLDRPALSFSGERCGEDLELLLLHALARGARAGGGVLTTVEPWPDGVSGVITLRHDVDRVVAPRDWVRLLDWERRQGLRASWYFLPHTADASRMAEVVGLGHEVGFHYTNLRARGETELAGIAAAAEQAGTRLVGACCHGGNYHGMNDVEWLGRRGFVYGELLSRCALFPFRPVRLRGLSGVAEGPLATARHVSVDKRMSPPEADFSYALRTMKARHRIRSHIVVMNHPDINFDALVDSVNASRRPGDESWTQAETVDWWRRSHTDGVRLERVPLGDGVAMRLCHSAARPPVLRMWASGAADDGRADFAFGEEHTLVPADGSCALRPREGASHG